MTEQLRLTRASDIEPETRGERRPEWGSWDIGRTTFVLWTDAPGYRYAWVDVSSGSTAGDIAPQLRHLAARAGQRFGAHAGLTTLCGFTFVDEDVAAVEYGQCRACLREQRLRGVVVPAGSVAGG